MKTQAILKVLLAGGAMLAGASHADVVATFDNLAAPPPLNSATGLQYTNASNSLQYEGVTWDGRLTVVGDQYRVAADGPLFGMPHSGHYFVTNQNGDSGLTLATSQVLTGAWFGRNQYYGYSEGGADQITIVALHGGTALGAVVFDLPESHPGQPEPLSFVDTHSFAALSGITGYRIDRREVGTQAGHWVADDFQFTSAVPEPGSAAMWLGGLGGLLWRVRRQRAA